MTKKVRFNDNVQVNKMSINLTDHIKEVKLAKDIILDPSKSLPSTNVLPIDVESLIPVDNKFLDIPINFWILAGIILIIVLVIFFTIYIRKRIFSGNADKSQ